MFNVAAFVLCFIALYVLAMLVVNLLDHVISFPLIRGFDWLVGGLLGLVRGVVICILVLNLLPAVAQIVSPEFANNIVETSVLMNFVRSFDLINVGQTITRLIGG